LNKKQEWPAANKEIGKEFHNLAYTEFDYLRGGIWGVVPPLAGLMKKLAKSGPPILNLADQRIIF